MMADRYPRYVRNASPGPGVFIPNVPTPVAEQQTLRNISNVSENISRVQKFAFDRMAQANIDKATTEARADPGGTYERLKDVQYKTLPEQAAYKVALPYAQEQINEEAIATAALDPARTISELTGQVRNTEQEAAYRAAMELSSLNIEVEAKKRIEDLIWDWKKNNKDPELARSELADLVDGYSTSISDIDPVDGAKLHGRLDISAHSALQEILAHHQGYVEDQLEGKFVDLSGQTLQEIESLARVGESDEILDDRLADFVEASQLLGIHPAKIETKVGLIKQRAHIERVYGEFDRAENKAEFLAAWKADVAEGGTGLARDLDGTNIKALTGYMQTTVNGQASEATRIRNKQIATLKDEIRAQSAIYSDGRPADFDLVGDVLQKATFLQDPELMKMAVGLSANAELYHRIRKDQSPPRIIQEHANALYKTFMDNDGSIDELENSALEMLQNMADKSELMLNNDQVAYYNNLNSDNPLTGLSPSDFAADPEKFAAMVRERREKIDEFSDRMEARGPLFLSETEAASFDGFFLDDNIHVDAKMMVMSALNENMGDDSKYLFGQVNDKFGHSWSYAGGILSVSGNDTYARDLFLGTHHQKSGLQAVAETGERAIVVNTVNKVLAESGIDPMEWGQINSAINAVYLTRRLNSGDMEGAYNPELLMNIVQESLGARFVQGEQYGGIYNQDGEPVTHKNISKDEGPTVLVRPEMSQRDVEFLFENWTKDDLLMATRLMPKYASSVKHEWNKTDGWGFDSTGIPGIVYLTDKNGDRLMADAEAGVSNPNGYIIDLDILHEIVSVYHPIRQKKLEDPNPAVMY